VVFAGIVNNAISAANNIISVAVNKLQQLVADNSCNNWLQQLVAGSSCSCKFQLTGSANNCCKL